MSPFEIYKVYTAIINHFHNKKYDYFLYNGKLKNISVSSYEKRKDRYFFEYLSANKLILSKEDLETKLAICHHLERDVYIKNFVNWCAKIKSCGYYWKYVQFTEDPVNTYMTDLNSISDSPRILVDPLYIFKFYTEKKILLETFLFLDNKLSLVKRIMRDYNPVMEEELYFIEKYYPFSSLRTMKNDVLDRCEEVTLRFITQKSDMFPQGGKNVRS